MSIFDEMKRVTFHKDTEIMEVDFSDFQFENSKDVNAVYDAIETLIAKTQNKWYFMINYKNTQISPDAWFQFALRGKDINVASSLGSVRFDPREPTREEILKRAKNEDFSPNLVSSREEALARINEIRVKRKASWNEAIHS